MEGIKRTIYRYSVTRERVMLASDGAERLYTTAVTNHETAASLFRMTIGDPPAEHFVAFYLDTGNRIVGYETIAIGGQASVYVEARCVFRGAILAGASAIIVAHNHPSGQCRPSADDDGLTARIVEAGRLLGVDVLDHVIVTAGECYSYRAHGKC